MANMPKIASDPLRYEYLDGRPYAKASPKRTHALVQLNLGSIMLAQGRSLGQLGTEWRFMTGNVDGTRTEFVPDISFVSSERLASLPPDKREKPAFSPDVAVEVRSPSDNLAYLREKIERCLRTGSVLVLDVDPQRQEINAHSAEGVRKFNEDEHFQHREAPWLTFAVCEAFEGLD